MPLWYSALAPSARVFWCATMHTRLRSGPATPCRPVSTTRALPRPRYTRREPSRFECDNIRFGGVR